MLPALPHIGSDFALANPNPEIAANAITTMEIADGSVTDAKITDVT